MPNPFQSNSGSLFVGLIIFLGLIVGYFMYSGGVAFVSQPSFVSVTSPDQEKITKLESINLDLSIFDKIAFKQLKIFGSIPVNQGKVGKSNPFSP